MKELLIFLLGLIVFSTIVSAATDDYLKEKWTYEARERVNGIHVADFDNDGKKEIAAIASISGEVYLIGYKGNELWRKSVFCPVYSISGGDLDNDGYEEILVGSCTHMDVFSHSGERKWSFFTNHGAVQVILPIDIDNDGNLEILIGAGDATSKRNNNLYLVTSEGKLIWKKGLPASPTSIDVKDINADGVKEIVIGTGASGLGWSSYKGWIIVYDEYGTKLWEERVKYGVESVKVTDLDKDGNFEVIAGSFYSVYSYDKKGNLEGEYTTGAHVYSLGVIEIDKKRHLIVGSNDITALNPKFKKEWSYNTGDETYVVKVVDIDNDGEDEILTGSDKLYVLSNKGELLWSSDYFTTVKGIFFDDLDEDSYNEVIVGALNSNVYVFETKEHIKKQEANENLRKAKEAYENKNYENATLHAEIAQMFYDQLNENSKVKECKDLLKEIRAIKEEDVRNKRDAQEYYNESLALFLEDEFKTAIISARKAEIYYLAINKKDSEIEEGIEECEILINNSIDGLKLQADEQYENASNLYENEEYEKALEAAHDAKAIYEWINETNASKKAKALMAKIFYTMAEEEYEKNQIENATIHINASLKIYTELGNGTFQEEIEKCDELFDKISKGPKRGLDTRLIAGVVIILLAIFVIIWVILLLKKKGALGERKELEKPKRVGLREIYAKVGEEEEKIAREEPVKEEAKAEKPKKERKKKIPRLEPIKKDKFRGVGMSLRL